MNSGTAITDVMITFGNTMVTDSSMETAPFPCFGIPAWIPIVDFGNSPGEGVLAFGQQSNLNGVTNWNLAYSEGTVFGGPAYTNGITPTLNSSRSGGGCTIVSCGNFSWTSAANGVVRNGEIYIDIVD